MATNAQMLQSMNEILAAVRANQDALSSAAAVHGGAEGSGVSVRGIAGADVAAFDDGRYCTLLLDFFEGREAPPRLVWPKLLLPAYRQDVVPVMKLVQHCDCDSPIKHLLAENIGLLQDRRFLGYV